MATIFFSAKQLAMPALNPACDTDPFPDWPFGVNSDRRVIVRDEWVRVPLDVVKCPTCHFMLEATPMHAGGHPDASRARARSRRDPIH